MEGSLERMESQLRTWSSQIDELAAKTHRIGSRAGIDALTDVDELKALRAIAQSKLDELNAAEGTRRIRLTTEMKRIWRELDSALKNSMS